MAANLSSLNTLLAYNVVELAFIRRNRKRGWPWNRRMLCTNNKDLLNSMAGRLTLNFAPPTQPPAYNYTSKNLACTWDILWQDWRMLPAEAVNVIATYPVRNKLDIDRFWEFFTKMVYPMTTGQKTKFMKGGVFSAHTA